MRFLPTLILSLLLSNACTQINNTEDFIFTNESPDSSNDTAHDTTTENSTDTTLDTAGDPGSDSGGDSDSDTSINTISCKNYCDAILDICVDENAQYTTNIQCLQICASMDIGTGEDNSGNTLGCRSRFALEAIEFPDVHCASAGPGGNGVCGTNCESFCHGTTAICTEDNQQFSSYNACLGACATLEDTVPYHHTILSGNSLACRLSHLSLAAGVPDTHCPHLALDSPVCF